MPLKPDEVKVLSDALISPETINQLDGHFNQLSKQVAECKTRDIPETIYNMTDMAFAIGRGLPRKCPTTEKVLATLEDRLLVELNTAISGLEKCCPKKPERVPTRAPVKTEAVTTRKVPIQLSPKPMLGGVRIA